MRTAFLLPLAALAITGCNRASQPEQSAAGNEANIASPAPAPAVDLSRYVGKYPFDVVDGAKFKDIPVVREAILVTVRDAKVRGWVTSDDLGPSTPIAERDGALLIWGCEAHNCGMHNWTLIIRPDGTGAQICYHDDDDGGTRWFAQGELLAKKDDCPSGDAN